jgi:hypothetical protein
LPPAIRDVAPPCFPADTARDAAAGQAAAERRPRRKHRSFTLSPAAMGRGRSPAGSASRPPPSVVAWSCRTVTRKLTSCLFACIVRVGRQKERAADPGGERQGRLLLLHLAGARPRGAGGLARTRSRRQAVHACQIVFVGWTARI